MRVLGLEPYYGGSHQAFLDGWQRHSQHQWTVLHLPSHHWKWRMRHAPLTFAEQVRVRGWRDQDFDVVFCSDMLDVAAWRGLCPQLAALPVVLYFHENQLTYPNQVDRERDLHFAFTNFQSAVAANQIWFNSKFHREQWIEALQDWLPRFPDYSPVNQLSEMKLRTEVHSPGIEAMKSIAAPAHPPPSDRPLEIAWAARWEHDKNPEDFFAAIGQLAQRGIDFRLTILGKSYREVPAVFDDAYQQFQDQIQHWGFANSRGEYLQRLAAADLFVSTATHEFFGIAAAEAMAAGVVPVLPDRLAYPELLQSIEHPERYLYDGSVQDLVERLTQWSSDPELFRLRPTVQAAMSRLHWPVRAAEMDRSLSKVVDNHHR